tara:strand:+ start:981 stop:1214 length:234 start_codon:yes stop_codon:yes gene_type:complete
MVVDPKTIKTIVEFNSWVFAYERVIEDFQKIIEKHGNEEYLEQRLHKLNCVYADLLMKRLDLIESEMHNHQKASYPL